MERKANKLRVSSPTKKERAVLDSLYFITSFDELVAELQWPADEVHKALISLIKKGWVVQFVPQKGIPEPIEGLDEDMLRKSFFVATREGLLAHNSRK